ncbi:MAG: cytidine deaminase [Salibacteraceae bacterium]
MQTKSINLTYTLVDSADELSDHEQELVLESQRASRLAYAPYSHFNVGAAARLSSGELVTASNKENASFPAGVCAERNLLNYISDHFSDQKIETIAISALAEDFELEELLTPCGICRQVLGETEKLQQSPIRLILSGPKKTCVIFNSSLDLIPFHFYVKALKK